MPDYKHEMQHFYGGYTLSDLMLKIENVSKMYKLGEIGGTTLREELQRWNAKMRGEDDPTKRIGTKNYNKGNTFMALDDVSFEVKKGERVGIIGHNGAGKSTLLKLISRVTAPTEGRIGLNGRVASMLEVGTGFHGELTGRENIYMNGAILGMTKKEIDTKIEEIIDFSECRQFIDTPVKRYSSGMYVRLAFAVAAHLDSEIMIMDEVLAVGDLKFQQKCLGKMGEESSNSGKTILYVSHNMSTVRALCNRCIVLEHGKLIYDGDVSCGIQLYSGNAGNKDAVLDTRNAPRRNGIDQRAQISQVEVLNGNGWFFQVGEPIRIRIKWDCYRACHSLMYRILLHNNEGTVIAMAPTEETFAAEKGENLVNEITVDLINLMPGDYWMSIMIADSEQKSACDFDWLDKAISFEIVSDGNNPTISAWSTRDYGNIKLPAKFTKGS